MQGLLHAWACSLGKCGERKFHFDEELAEVADEVAHCLEVMPIIMETASGTAWGPKHVAGFYYITELLSDSAIKTIRALEAERKALKNENRKLRKRLNQRQKGEANLNGANKTEQKTPGSFKDFILNRSTAGEKLTALIMARLLKEDVDLVDEITKEISQKLVTESDDGDSESRYLQGMLEGFGMTVG